MPPLNNFSTGRIVSTLRYLKATILCKTFFSDILALGLHEFGYFPIMVAPFMSTKIVEFEGQFCAFKVAGASSVVWD
jgi:hypothetical protein